MPKIFISHAHKDKILVTKFVDMILDLGCGVDRNNIFYTSDPDKGIKEGKNFIDELKKHLKDAPLVILMLSPNYFNSQFCLGELGATWVLDCDIFPIVIPDIEIGKVQGILQVTHMGMIDNKDYLGGLHDELVPINPKTPTWNTQCDSFLKLLPDLLKQLPKPTIIQTATYEKLQRDLAETKKRIDEQKTEIASLKKLNEEISKLKNQEEVKAVRLSNSSINEQFKQLIKNAKEAFEDTIEGPSRVIVGIVLFYHFKEGEFYPSRHVRPNESQYYYRIADLAVAKGYIQRGIDGDDITFYSPHSRKIGYVIQELEELLEFNPGDIDYTNDDFIKYFSDEYGYGFEFDSYKEDGLFWERYLGIKLPS